MILDDEKITTTHILAPTGWMVGSRQVDDDSLACGIWWEPVIAGVVRTSEMNGEATHSWVDPVSIGGVNAGDRYVIRAPDGILHEPENGSPLNDDDVVKGWRDQDMRAKAIREARAKK